MKIICSVLVLVEYSNVQPKFTINKTAPNALFEKLMFSYSLYMLDKWDYLLDTAKKQSRQFFICKLTNVVTTSIC